LDACEIRRSGFLTLIIITAAFSLWHIGYMDVFLIHPIHPNLNIMLISKIGIGMVLGLITGLIRLKTGKVYGSFLFHAFWNTFAP
ncbi:CPBP family glutamic-type intramembrane protease, partial [Methanobacterium alcaliphilum]|uniref:CPBP family glutamic-type intramembrane protease n=1 Tax=Methanobacterium alcaliphilum TaxID=392018 RepID=UPI00200A7326